MYSRMIRFLLCLGVCILLVACSGGAEATESEGNFETPISNQVEVHEESAHSDAEGHEHVHLDPAEATAEMGVALVPSQLVVGLNRFAVGLFDVGGQVVHEAEVHFHYYDLTNPDAPVLESHAEATPLHTPDGLTTVFAQDREFAKAGKWGVEIQARFADGTASMKRIGFEVLAESSSPIPGEAVPSVETATGSEVNNDLSKITSAPEPNPAFYEQSLSEAISNGKPTVLLFATPAFCQTRFCGPAYEVTSELQQRYGNEINFVHVEIYTGLPNPADNDWEMAPAMSAFGLTTEPWIFLIDRQGVVVYRVEGLFTTEEIEHYFPTLLDS